MTGMVFGHDAGSEGPLHGLVATAAMLALWAGDARRRRTASDAVIEWNQIALAATVTANQGPLPQIRSMAIVQVSVHDAVNAITRDYETYLHIGRRAWGVSADAAAIGAAHHALVESVSGASHGVEHGARGIARRTWPERVRSGHPVRRSGRSCGSEATLDRRLCAGAVSVYRARRRRTWGMGRDQRCSGAASWLGKCDAVGDSKGVALPTRWSSVTSQPALCSRLQRGERDRIAHQRDADRRGDRDWAVLARAAVGHLEWRRASDDRGSPTRSVRQPRARSRSFISRPPMPRSSAGMRSTPSTSGDPSPPSSRVTPTATIARAAIRPGRRCFRRHRIPTTCPATRRTAARWRRFSERLFGDRPGRADRRDQPDQPGLRAPVGVVQRGGRGSDRRPDLLGHPLPVGGRRRGPCRTRGRAACHEPPAATLQGSRTVT